MGLGQTCIKIVGGKRCLPYGLDMPYSFFQQLLIQLKQKCEAFCIGGIASFGFARDRFVAGGGIGRLSLRRLGL